ncbi:tetratricopeptide repeat protein [Campylobacter molothri]|uniref:tetratricopeptide repeat protein n=1 Tax=Campylobacter molothri TaxID=1032242 RepID=UPI001D512DD7|nr:tetratricopeptide repeat protein [Campylobacter sp. W0045]
MLNQVYYYYFNSNYEKCLEISEKYLDSIDALTYATLCSFKLSINDKALYYAKQLFLKNATSFNGLLLSKAYIFNSKFQEALDLFEKLLKKNDALHNEINLELALLFQITGKLEEAEKIFQNLLKKDPYDLNLWKSYAEIYFKKDCNKALKAHEELCAFWSQTNEKIKQGLLVEKTHSNASNFQDRLQNKTKENITIAKIEEFLNTQILPQKAYLLFKLFKIEQSLTLFYSLQEFNQHNAQFWQNYAKVLEFNSNYQNAYHAYQKALSLHSHATYKFDLAYLLMRMGTEDNFEEGKKFYESRLFYAHNETFSVYHYNKTMQIFNKNGIDAFKNKEILIFCEQGFGDTIMYSRCLEKICQIAQKVLFAPQSAMYEMFKNQIKFLNQSEKNFRNLKVLKTLPKKFDYAMPICSLPFFMDIKLTEISQLKTPIKAYKKPQNKIKKIGIFWFTPNAIDSETTRNFELNFLLDALKDMSYKIISFQMQGDYTLSDKIENRAKKIKNWNDTLNNLNDIDCMITIDSAIAHLSLALEIPTIVLLKPRFDWRWGKFEQPKSFFWPKAKILVIKDEKDGATKLNKLIETI